MKVKSYTKYDNGMLEVVIVDSQENSATFTKTERGVRVETNYMSIENLKKAIEMVETKKFEFEW